MTVEQPVLTDNGLEIKKKIRFSPYLLWAFFVPAAIFLVIYLIRGVYPIGESSVLVLDLNAQYIYFLERFRDILQGEGSLLYSWQRALGGEFMGMYAYYLASPFNILLALFPSKYITEALLTIFVLKAGFSGFNFAVYLHFSGRAKNKYATVIFSSMYALTAFAIVNAHNTMWIDILLFLPITILSLENLINKKKYILYTVILAVSVISNFYIGYMLCLFIFVYAIYYYFAYGYSDKYNETGEKLHAIKSFLRVLFFSVLALAMSAVVLFTIYYSLKFGKNDFSDPSYDLASKFNFLELLAKGLPGSYDTVRPEGLPFIYCGMLSLILVPVFFISKKVTPREKICAGLILSVIIISFAATTLDLFWHGMQKPNWLNYRYSFMFCFLLVVLAHQAFTLLKDIKFSHITGVCGILVLITVLIQAEKYDFVDSVLCIWFSLICIGVYLLALYVIKREKTGNFAALILAILVSTELLLNGYLNLAALDEDVIFTSRTAYREYIDKITPTVDYLQEADTSFYRYEKKEHRRTNDNMTLGIRGISSSTSTLNASVIKLLNQLGYASKAHWSKYLGGTPVSDSLLGIKYVISEKQFNDLIYEDYYRDENYYIYENPYAMSVAFAVSTDLEFLDFSTEDNPFELMNAMVTCMLGADEPVLLFKPIENIEESADNASRTFATSLYLKYVPKNTANPATVTYTFTAGTTDEIFFFYPSDYPRKVSLTLNGMSHGTFFDNETDRIVTLGTFDSDEEVELRVKLEDDNLYLLRDQKFFYYLDTELYKEVMTKLNEGRFNVVEHSDTYLKGDITVSQDEALLFTSIPYDEGWQVYCDGERVPVFKTANALLSVELPKGEHILELKYMPDCFVYGSIVSAAGVALFVIIIVVDSLIKQKRKKKLKAVIAAEAEFYDSFVFPEGDENTENTETDVSEEAEIAEADKDDSSENGGTSSAEE